MAVLGLDHHRVTDELAETIRNVLDQRVTVVYDDALAKTNGQLPQGAPIQWESIEADFLVVVGGDGSILSAAGRMGDHQLPVLGVNLGRLGFLADITPDDLDRVVTCVADGDCQIVDHLMFDCAIWRDDHLVSSTLGLNETAVLTGPPFRIVEVDLFVDDELATTYSCDGLLISTPVGSTAHNLSAGGPILRKNLDAFVISPVSPHTLTVRPVVDSADRQFRLVVPAEDANACVVVDGDQIHTLQASDSVVVRRARPRFQLIAVEGHGYYRTLREKLGWGGWIRRSPTDQSR